MAPYKLAYFVTHPIQYQAPLLRLIAAQPDLDLTVFFQSDLSVRGYRDRGFGVDVKWDVPLLNGYRYEFLPAIGRTDRVDSFRPWTYGIASRLRRGRFDFLWVHGYSRPINWAALIAARLSGTATLVRDEATAISARRSALKTGLKRLFFASYRAICDGVLAIGTLNRDFYLANDFDPARVFMVPYAVDNDYFAKRARAAAALREQFRASLRLGAGRQIIFFASKFQRRKRADDLIAAYSRYVERLAPEVRPYLLLAGDGEMRAALKAQAQPLRHDVRFIGFKNQSELPALFDLCDVFVLPSDQEPWGLVVNEAMNASRAIIVSDQVGCAPDLVRDGVNGAVFPVGNIDALAGALGRVLDNPATTTAMGRASFEIIGGWNLWADIEGLRRALHALRPRPA